MNLVNDLTELESKFMRTIPKECFYEEKFNSVLWTDCFLDTLKACEEINQKQARALITSLKKKQYIGAYSSPTKVSLGSECSESTLWLQEKGKEWLLAEGYVSEDGSPARIIKK